MKIPVVEIMFLDDVMGDFRAEKRGSDQVVTQFQIGFQKVIRNYHSCSLS